MLPELTAVHLHRQLTSGRSRPAVFGCVDKHGDPAGDYVVKLSASMDLGETAAANEALGSFLANWFHIQHPEPASIRIAPDLVSWLVRQNSALGAQLKASPGFNFGTRVLTNVTTWPKGKALPEAMLPAAAQVFALDALISNDDRRLENPNVLIRGDEVFVIDHECAFAFLLLLPSKEPPWRLRNRTSLSRHVFYLQLRKQALALEPFIARLAGLGEEQLTKMIDSLPFGWRHDGLSKVSSHLKEIREHAAEFERELLEVLA